jgi:benzoate/toluate 1,2-dioxygenase beta subunit
MSFDLPATPVEIVKVGHPARWAVVPSKLLNSSNGSSASTPEPRTSDNISNVEILSQSDSKVELRFNWLTLSYRYKIIDSYFGVSFYTLETTGEHPLIKAKKVVLKNDYIHHVVDVYHI